MIGRTTVDSCIAYVTIRYPLTTVSVSNRWEGPVSCDVATVCFSASKAQKVVFYSEISTFPSSQVRVASYPSHVTNPLYVAYVMSILFFSRLTADLAGPA
jgi:hypothetical protein